MTTGWIRNMSSRDGTKSGSVRPKAYSRLISARFAGLAAVAILVPWPRHAGAAPDAEPTALTPSAPIDQILKGMAMRGEITPFEATRLIGRLQDRPAVAHIDSDSNTRPVLCLSDAYDACVRGQNPRAPTSFASLPVLTTAGVDHPAYPGLLFRWRIRDCQGDYLRCREDMEESDR